ncbi:helix-turn-helix transcriptional regulator [Cohnella faecalis]|uniref:AraC family transcriptional regulator n=1 Tax=Cohnella faecalis TaxID=2315694 RepID=A0A398CYR5_9BACL|nr:helix-turn-helix transcriptional regulator [Cohnella faecalis]RIE04977.1 AraC family transcriptional regulator [Cohnella faecalis]RIE05385.1 AraC family transcriptional regulator [Cohnella faecalis]
MSMSNESLPVNFIEINFPNSSEWSSSHFQIVWESGMENMQDSTSIAMVRPDLPIAKPTPHASVISILFEADFLTKQKNLMNAKMPLEMPLNGYSKTILSQILEYGKQSSSNSWKKRIACAIFSLTIEFLDFFSSGQQSPPSLFSKPKGTEPKEAKAIIYATRYIRNHMANPDLSLDELAQAIGYNPNYFCQEFSRILSVSPIRYLNKLRLDRAMRLLEHSDHSVRTICNMVGIRNPSRLASMVKLASGMNPLVLRRTKKLQNLMYNQPTNTSISFKKVH